MPLRPFACSNCGFWQRYFSTPPSCPVCSDTRNALPDDGWDFREPDDLIGRLRFHWREAIPGVWEFWSSPRFGLDSHGWLLTYPDGNVAFEAAPIYDAAQIAQIEALGGISLLAASHPHGYGALFQLQDRFDAPLFLHKGDLQWTKAMRVTHPYDDVQELRPGLTLHHTGGHYEGHAVLHDSARRAVFAGDALKIDLTPDGRPHGISCHKAYHKQIPLTRNELAAYRAVFERLDFDTVFTPFECAVGVTTSDALRLLDHVAEEPSTKPMVLTR